MKISLLSRLGVALLLLFVPVGLYSRQVSGSENPKNALPRAFVDGKLVRSVKVGNRSVSDLEGREVTLGAFRGKTLFITFWAPWSLDSITTIQGLQIIAENFASKGIRDSVEFLPVSDTNIDDVESVKLARDSYGIDLPLYVNHELFDYFDVRSIPLTLIIDKDGRVIYRISGYVKWYSDAVMKELFAIVGEEK